MHYVNPDGRPDLGNHVAAIITRVWNDTCVNLRVFFDGTNDVPEGTSEWVTSVVNDESKKPAERTWHWPERV